MRAPVVAASSAPDASAIESVRHLERRFPDARLREVPIVRAAELDLRADASGATRVWLALEALQVTGSFKVRGALVGLEANRGRGHIVAASAGNHGAAVAYAGSVLDVRVTVCVPRTAPLAKRSKIERYGAELVIAASDNYDDAESLAKEIAATQGAAFLSPYDDVDVVLGNGVSLGLEIVRGLGGVPERILAPVGGGGLVTGLSWAMQAESDDPADRSVWGVQSKASCAMAMSIERGAAVERLETGGTTLAEGLEGGVSTDGFERARAALGGVVVVTEEQIAEAMLHAYRDMGLVLEGSAATALAPILNGLPDGLGGGDVLVVLTGRNVDPSRLESLGQPER
ncbi:MAG TPA: pyridoxal-phosphate dependent enzyme [Polyangiaceae bacterium]